MAYDKQQWGYYDEAKTEEQNIQEGNVYTPEKMNYIENGIEQVQNETNDKIGVNTAKIATVESKVNGLQTGLGETFSTLAALNSRFPNGDVKDHLVSSNGHRYYWSSGWQDGGLWNAAFIGDNSITSNKIAPNSVTVDKADFLEEELAEDSAYDIMPKTLSAIGDFYDPSNGVLSNNANTQNFKNTGKIFLNEKGIIESYGNNSLLFFTASDVFISATLHGGDEAIAIKRRIEPPESTSYFIANVPKPYWWDADDLVFTSLTASLSFIPIKERMDVLRVKDENLEQIIDPGFSPVYLNPKITLSVDGKVLDINTGNEIAQAGRKHSDWFSVSPVQYKTFGVSHVLFKRSDGSFIKSYLNFNNDEALATWQTWTPPVGAVTMAFNLVTFYYERSEFFMMESTVKKGHIDNLALESIVKSMKKFYGKKIVHMGDSITGNYSYPSDIATVIAENLDAEVKNMGFGGTRTASHPNPDFNNFSFHKLVDAITSGNFAAQEASSKVTGIGMPGYFKSKILALKVIDFSLVDVLVISYGTNDWNGVVPLDNLSNPLDVNSFTGSLRYAIAKLSQKYPKLKIVITTPIYRFKEDGSADSDDWIAGDKKLTDFVDVLHPLGKEVKCLVIDCYYTMGVNKYNKLTYFASSDGTHPNYELRKLMAHKISGGISYNL